MKKALLILAAASMTLAPSASAAVRGFVAVGGPRIYAGYGGFYRPFWGPYWGPGYGYYYASNSGQVKLDTKVKDAQQLQHRDQGSGPEALCREGLRNGRQDFTPAPRAVRPSPLPLARLAPQERRPTPLLARRVEYLGPVLPKFPGLGFAAPFHVLARAHGFRQQLAGRHAVVHFSR